MRRLILGLTHPGKFIQEKIACKYITGRCWDYAMKCPLMMMKMTFIYDVSMACMKYVLGAKIATLTQNICVYCIPYRVPILHTISVYTVYHTVYPYRIPYPCLLYTIPCTHPFVVGGLGFVFYVFVAGWRHFLRSEWPFIIIIIIIIPIHGGGQVLKGPKGTRNTPFLHHHHHRRRHKKMFFSSCFRACPNRLSILSFRRVRVYVHTWTYSLTIN